MTTCAAAAAQEPGAVAEDGTSTPLIVVQGIRGSAIADIAPIAELDADAIAATGATSIEELRRAIQGQTQSADGSEPIFLLNAQRVAGYQEIGSLPPEAIEKVEVLPEQAAIRFGYPPTRRVVNFITKRRFGQVELKAGLGSTLPTGRATASARAGVTRLRGDARITANLDYARSDALLHTERGVAPDPDIPFDAIGNITAPGGGEIDPALTAAAGVPVTIAPVPGDPAERSRLAAYAVAANNPRLFTLGHYATLAPRNDTLKGEAVIAGPVGEGMGGSATLSIEHSRDSSLGGPASAALLLPETNPFSPFASPVLLNRYLTETDPLRQDQTRTTLAAGLTLRGALAGWQWDATGALNQVTTQGVSERGIDLAAATAAIAAGADPFGPLDASLLAARLTDRTRQRTRNLEAKLNATGSPLELPAGKTTLTAMLEAARSTAASSLEGASPFTLDLGRSRIEGGLGVDLPLTSREADVAAFLGSVSVNASANLRRIVSLGWLRDTTLGVAWSPFQGMQLLASGRRSEAPPDLVQLSTPPRTIENVPVFDFAAGRTEVVTLFLGGNPELRPERRDTRSLSLNVKPWPSRAVQIGLSYEDITIRDQTGMIYAGTPRIEALLPELFSRDATGRLVAVTFRPINFDRERRRKLQLSLTASGRLGTPPPPPAESGRAPTPDTRATYYFGLVPTLALEDRLRLQPGTPELDLLGGDSIGGYTPRLFGYAYGGINRAGYGGSFSAYYGGERRINGGDPGSDLTFQPFFKVGMAAYLPAQALVPGGEWAKRLQLRLDVENLFDSRQRVVDGEGRVPSRYQTDLIDPLGRTVTLSLRKRF